MGQSLTPKLAIVARRLGPSAGPRALEAHHVALTLAYAAEVEERGDRGIRRRGRIGRST